MARPFYAGCLSIVGYKPVWGHATLLQSCTASTENLQSSPNFIDCTILYRIFGSHESLDTVNEERFAGLNFHVFLVFKSTVIVFPRIVILYKLCMMVLFKCFKRKIPQHFSVKIWWDPRKFFSPANLSVCSIILLTSTIDKHPA